MVRRIITSSCLWILVFSFISKSVYAQKTDSVAVAAGKHYNNVSKLYKVLLGKNYREVWAKEIKFPIVSIEEEGFEILELGGGQQTKSLKLRHKNGKEYSLRSVEKYPEKAVPFALRETIAQDIVEDQISASFPFAAITIPPLAEAIEVLHTNPKYIIIQKGDYLGQYKDEFGGRLALLEERPDEDWQDSDFFGNSKNIVSTSNMLKNIEKSSENKVDKYAFLRARILDLFIGDWDRHEDQWRWAEYDSGAFKFYTPIPRDRDQAYFVNEGLIPGFVGSRWALPKVQGFDEKVNYVEGFMSGGLHLDRRILSELSRAEWNKIIQFVQNRLTNEVIEQALLRLPEEAYKISGKEIATILKVRRDDLKEYALEYYEYLSNEVDVVGSDLQESFSIYRNNKDVKVIVADVKDSTRMLYTRVFDSKETKTINIFGIGNDDHFLLKGNSGSSSPIINIIGGKGKDRIVDSSYVSGWRKKNRFFDSKKGCILSYVGPETSIKNSKKEKKYRYKNDHFTPKQVKPLLRLGYDRDRDLAIDLGWRSTSFALFKDPNVAQQEFYLNYQTGSKNFEAYYTGSYTLNNESLEVIADFNPMFNRVENFFGLGNATDYIEDFGISFYRFESLGLNLGFGLRKSISNHTIRAKGVYELRDLDNSGSVPIGEIVGDNDTGFFSKRNYSGFDLGYAFNNVADKVLPKDGVSFEASYRNVWALGSNANNYKALDVDFRFYKSISTSKKWVIDSRLGYGRNFREFDFFNARTLGGLDNLRGLRNNRFSGEEVFFNNTQLRVELKSFRSYLFPGTYGLLFFNDTGRVWFDSENSGRWHVGYGGGIWIAPLRQSLFVFSVAGSNDSNEVIPTVSSSFFF
ncbi:MAG: BamA/TamA family outer membrane protein [Bacteroidota bacterium]